MDFGSGFPDQTWTEVRVGSIRKTQVRPNNTDPDPQPWLTVPSPTQVYLASVPHLANICVYIMCFKFIMLTLCSNKHKHFVKENCLKVSRFHILFQKNYILQYCLQ